MNRFSSVVAFLALCAAAQSPTPSLIPVITYNAISTNAYQTCSGCYKDLFAGRANYCDGTYAAATLTGCSWTGGSGSDCTFSAQRNVDVATCQSLCSADSRCRYVTNYYNSICNMHFMTSCSITSAGAPGTIYQKVVSYVLPSSTPSPSTSIPVSPTSTASPSLTASASPSISITASPSLAPVGLQVTNVIANTYSNSASNWAFSGSFTQTFISAGTGFPRYLNVYMGNNQNPFDVTVSLSVNGVNILTRRYTGLVQIYNEWTVPFDFGVLGNYIRVGDTVSFTLSSPSTSVGFNAITSQITNFTQGTVSGYGSANARFYLRTVDYVSQSPSASISVSPSASITPSASISVTSAPSTSTSPSSAPSASSSVSASASPTLSLTASPSAASAGLPVTNTIANTYSTSASTWGFTGSFTQTFVSSGTGYPRYLNVWMGNNQNPFDITVSLQLNGVTIFSRRFTGLVQIMNEWTVPFDFGVLGNYIQIGDTVSFTLSSPSTNIGFDAITSQISGLTQGTISGYGNANARFYFRTVDYVSQSPSASTSPTPAPSVSASVSAAPSV